VCPAACYVHYSNPATKPLTFGAAFEVRLIRRLSVQAEGFYHRVGYSSVFELGSPSSGLTFAFSKTTATRWEVPLFLKYRVGRRPFVLAGAAVDGIAGVHTEADIGGRDFFGHVSVQHTHYDEPGQMTQGPRLGALAGAGVELRAGPLRLAPQLRFTRWIATRFSAEPGIRSNQSDVAALLTLMF